MTLILTTAVFAAVLAFVLGATLGFFNIFFAVPVNPVIARIRETLPGVNCGACGFAGCDMYAAAIAAGNAGIASCTAGGSAIAEKLAEITGQSGEQVRQIVPALVCRGSKMSASLKGVYTGIPTCRGAKIAAGGTKLCAWGCLGFGDCVNVCAFGALRMDTNKGLPVIDYAHCTGCRKCISECPQGVLAGIDREQHGALLLCANQNPHRQGLIKTCKSACIKCGLCAKHCPRQCIDLKHSIPVIDRSRCDSCGVCGEKCPTKAIAIIEK